MKLAKTLLAALLVAMLVPVVPGIQETEQASAMEGSTNYKDMFNYGNRGGSPGSINGSTLRAASTSTRSDYEYRDARWMSSAAFVTKNKVSLKHDWTIQTTLTLPNIAITSEKDNLSSYVAVGLSRTNTAKSLYGYFTYYWKQLNSTDSSKNFSVFRNYSVSNSIADTKIGNDATAAWKENTKLSVYYDSYRDVMTVSNGTEQITFPGIRDSYITTTTKDAYFAIYGGINWNNKVQDLNNPQAPYNLNVQITFNSMTLPHLEPTISSIQIVNPETNQPYSKDDFVEPGTVVRVECTVQNTHAQAGVEQFPMHVKLANTGNYPTQGITPFADSLHPLQVNGTTVATAAGDNTVTGINGVPITLVGNNETKITYYATVDQSSGRAVTLSQALIEDSFGGTHYQRADLLAERPLVPGPSNGGSGDGVPGTDYHYVRFPEKNENGWNNTPVGVQFYEGDFDELYVLGENDEVISKLGDKQSWTYSQDTPGTTVKYRAHNSETGVISTVQEDTIRIDTGVPTITYDKQTNTLTGTDATSSGGVASGVWKFVKTDKNGKPLEDVQAYELENGAGKPSESTTAQGPGYYAVMDAAGNVSAPVLVSIDPPEVTRPGGTGEPGSPDNPTPAGPPYDPNKPLPKPTTTTDGDGLRHATYDETITEVINPDAPSFDGSLDEADARAIAAYRYALNSATGDVDVKTELLNASGTAPLSALDTTQPGECLIRMTATDKYGNTTTINLHYRFVNDSCPVIKPITPGGSGGTDGDGENEPKDPLTPDNPATTNPDGTQTVTVSYEVTEGVSRGTMNKTNAVQLFDRYLSASALDGGAAEVRVTSLAKLSGESIDSIDLSKPADYLITYEATDADGNTTIVRLTYHLIKSSAPGVILNPGQPHGPDNPFDPSNPTNPSDPLVPIDPTDPGNPAPKPLIPTQPVIVNSDGTQHAVVDDSLAEYTSPNTTWNLDDIRSFMDKRYSFTSANGTAVSVLEMNVTDSSGKQLTSINKARPGIYTICYKVADAKGNTTTVNLHYYLVSKPPFVTPDDTTPSDDPQAPGVTPNPSDPDNPGSNGSKPRQPLKPISVVVDPETGLVHAVVEDTVRVGLSEELMTPELMDRFILERYIVGSALDDGVITRGDVALFDADGNPVAAIDRTHAGEWLVEQLLTDSAGNTTTLRLHYIVVDGSISGNLSGENGSGSGSGAGSDSDVPADAAINQITTDKDAQQTLRRLPFTGALFGGCLLHPLFLLLMVLTCAYGLMRLRQEKRDKDADDPDDPGSPMRPFGSQKGARA